MSNTTKLLMIGLILLYVISPMDFFPGPIDDAIVILLGVAANKRAINGGDW